MWTAGAIAYRCRTCQRSSSSAICPECFKRGPHRDHDYIIYRSAAGGCCDCGDHMAWDPRGFCDRHQPGRESHALGPGAQPLALAACRLALADILVGCRTEAGISEWADEDPGPAQLQREARRQRAADALEWINRVAESVAFRDSFCAALLSPAGVEITWQGTRSAGLTPAAATLLEELERATVASLQEAASCEGPWEPSAPGDLLQGEWLQPQPARCAPR